MTLPQTRLDYKPRVPGRFWPKIEALPEPDRTLIQRELRAGDEQRRYSLWLLSRMQRGRRTA